MNGPSGGGAPVDTSTLFDVALGLAGVDALVEHPREVRSAGSSRTLTSREAARAMQTLAMISNVFAKAVPPAKVAEIRDALLAIYVDAGLVELPPVDCQFREVG